MALQLLVASETTIVKFQGRFDGKSTCNTMAFIKNETEEELEASLKVMLSSKPLDDIFTKPIGIVITVGDRHGFSVYNFKTLESIKDFIKKTTASTKE